MAAFTQDELFIIGKSLEDYFLKAGHKYRVGEDHSVHSETEIMDLRRKLFAIYAENLGEDIPNRLAFEKAGDTPPLNIGQFYRVVHQGHNLDGKRVKLETVTAETDTGPTRAWVISGIMSVEEVPAASLVACQ